MITDVGTSTGHLAAVARELRLPSIVDVGNATEILENGQVITVDAEENVVYRGRIEELLHYQLLQSSTFEESLEFRILRKMLRRIAPLHHSARTTRRMRISWMKTLNWAWPQSSRR